VGVGVDQPWDGEQSAAVESQPSRGTTPRPGRIHRSDALSDDADVVSSKEAALRQAAVKDVDVADQELAHAGIADEAFGFTNRVL
jgi:hypothetical protein